MKYMWMILFMVLPFLAIAYIAWHVWVMLPVSALWKSLVIVVGVLSIAMLFLNFGRKFDSYPLPVAQAAYEIGTSSIFILLYLVMIFLVLDLGRMVHLVPKAFLYHNGYTALGIFLLVFGIFLYGILIAYHAEAFTVKHRANERRESPYIGYRCVQHLIPLRPQTLYGKPREIRRSGPRSPCGGSKRRIHG